MHNEFRGFFTDYINLLADAIQRGIDAGVFRPVDPKATARVLMTMMQGTFASVYLSGIKYRSKEEAVGALLDVFFHGIEKGLTFSFFVLFFDRTVGLKMDKETLCRNNH